jgi:chitodextrinase
VNGNGDRRGQRARTERLSLAAVCLVLTLCFGLNGLARADVSDNFNRADGAEGGNWSALFNKPMFNIAGNEVVSSITNGSNSSSSYYNNGTLSADQSVEWEFRSKTASFFIAAVYARLTGSFSAPNGYFADFWSDGLVRIIRLDAGVETLLWNGPTGTFMASAGDVFRLRTVGNSIEVSINGTLLHAVTDSTYGNTGNAGKTIYTSGDGVLKMDNWVAHDIGSTTDTTPPTVPGNLHVTNTTSSTITLSLNASSDAGTGVGGYKVRRGANTFTVANTTFTDTNLASSTQYSYTVSAFDQATPTANESVQSSAVTGTTGTAGAQFTDNFNRADGAEGGNWSSLFNKPTFNIAGNEVMSSITDGSNASSSYYNSGTLSSEQSVEWEFRSKTASFFIAAVYARLTGSFSAPNGYFADFWSDGQVRLIRLDAGVEHLLWTGPAGTFMATAGDVFRLRASSNIIEVYVNGSLVHSHTDSIYSAAGYVGKTIYTSGDGVLKMDNWVAKSLLGGGGGSDTTPPTQPTGLSAYAQSSTRIDLNWVASTDETGGSGLSGYQIERCNGGNCLYWQIGSINSYSDTSTSPAATYVYRVRALDNAGNPSSYSSSASATTPNAPGAPVGLVPIVLGPYSIRLSWQAPMGTPAAHHYLIESCAGVGCTNLSDITPQSPQVTASPFDHTSLQAGSTHRYRIRAVDSSGNAGPYSQIVGTTTSAGQCQ